MKLNDNNYDYSTDLETQSLKEGKLKDKNRKRIRCFYPIINNSSVYVDILIADDKIDRCYIDFRTHKGCGKISGFYALRIISQPYGSSVSCRYICRKGRKESIGFVKMNEDPSVDLIEDLIEIFIPIINSRADSYNRKSITMPDEHIISNVLGKEGLLIKDKDLDDSMKSSKTKIKNKTIIKKDVY